MYLEDSYFLRLSLRKPLYRHNWTQLLNIFWKKNYQQLQSENNLRHLCKNFTYYINEQKSIKRNQPNNENT